MDYAKAQEFIDKTAELGSRLGLDSIRELLRRIGNPQDELKVIHVAGTNGKGSTCAFLEHGFRECKMRVGRYISPTLFEYLERYQIDENFMTEEEFVPLVQKVQRVCQDMEKDGFLHPTVFEVETAIAFLYFVEQKVDLVILETGMGGSEDATNVVKSPLATVFTSISYDHMAFLGETIEEIAICKAGIMRRGVPVVCGHMPPVVSKGVKTCAFVTLEEAAKRISAPLFDADKYELNSEIKNPLAGPFQWDNLKVAMLTAEVLRKKLSIEMDVFAKGVEKTKWPGRFETIARSPRIIRDGAHNPDAVLKLKEAIETDPEIMDRVHLIMGVYADKDYREEIEIIAPVAKSFTAVTSPNAARALEGRILASTAKEILTEIPVTYANTMSDAIKIINPSKEDVIVIFGSLSLAALTEELLKNKG